MEHTALLATIPADSAAPITAVRGPKGLWRALAGAAAEGVDDAAIVIDLGDGDAHLGYLARLSPGAAV